MATIGLKMKKHDPSGFKAFRNLTRGEILGFVVDTPTLTWNLGEEKGAKIIQAIEESYDKNHLHRPVYITLKTAQRAFLFNPASRLIPVSAKTTTVAI